MKIVYKTENGISIITPTGTIEDCMKDIPLIDIYEDTAEKIYDEGTGEFIGYETRLIETRQSEYKIIEDDQIPADRTFRNAWTYDLKEDIPKSKEIWKEKLRADRKPQLEILDVDYLKALELNDGVRMADIALRKQILRDLPSTVDNAKTIEEIKNITI